MLDCAALSALAAVIREGSFEHPAGVVPVLAVEGVTARH